MDGQLERRYQLDTRAVVDEKIREGFDVASRHPLLLVRGGAKIEVMPRGIIIKHTR